MTDRDDRACLLEAGGGATRLLDSYDPATDSWGVSFEGAFWDAVAHAHALGSRGEGRRIAIVDSEFDISLPALSSRVDAHHVLSPGQDPAHGTAVALLIARVAPEARFDLYSVARGGGRIDAGDVAAAITAAAATDVCVINVSLGAATVVPDLADAVGRLGADQVAAYFDQDDALKAKCEVTDVIAHHVGCRVCPSALTARGAGKIVFAAAGNDGSQILCPARSEGAVAAGFQSESQSVVHLPGNEGDAEVIDAADPHTPQSFFKDIALRETEKVLGTSYASPLFAGAATLGISAQELSCYINAIRPGMEGASAARLKTLGQGDQNALSNWAKVSFERAMRMLPHVHSGFEAYLRGSNTEVSAPETCATCGLLAFPTYVNYGLFLLDLGMLNAAASLLQAAVNLFPWSAEAAANYGRTLQNRDDLNGALQQYDRALSLRPGFPIYVTQRSLIAQAMTDRAAG